MEQKQSRFSRRSVALFWLALVAVVIGVLIYFEQVAVLYVLASISLMVLLLVVGFSDLEKISRDKAEGFAGNSD